MNCSSNNETEMDEVLTKRWNEKVTENDAVYIIREKLFCELKAGIDINNLESVSFNELLENNCKWYRRSESYYFIRRAKQCGEYLKNIRRPVIFRFMHIVKKEYCFLSMNVIYRMVHVYLRSS